MPARRCMPVNTAPTSGPRPRIISAGSVSTIVTCAPSWRAAQATSAPMKPPPMTTRRVPAPQLARRPAASAAERSTCTPGIVSSPGNRRGVEPVATTRPSKASRAPPCTVTRRLSRSRSMARPLTSWTPSSLSSVVVSSAGAVAAGSVRNDLDSGGRSAAIPSAVPGSFPIRTSSSAKPRRRSP